MPNSSPRKMDLLGAAEITVTLTGASLSATETTVSDGAVELKDLYRDIPTEEVTFNAGQVLRVKRARLIARGAPGLQVANDKAQAAVLQLLQGHESGGTFTQTTDTAAVPLSFVEWGEWEDKDLVVKFTEDNSVLGIATGAVFNYMDGNLQEAFENQDFAVMLELDAEVYIGG